MKLMQWRMDIIGALAAAALATAACAGVNGSPESVAPAVVRPLPRTSAEWYADYLAHARLVPLPDERSLNLFCLGSGAPTVILEAGIGGFAFDWRTVQAQIAAHTRVCAYDRAGLGASPAGPHPRDTRSEVADLEALLPAAGLRGPYVLVGHSMGGYNVRLFASRHLSDVAGIVLVDPSIENQIPILEAAMPEMAGQTATAVERARACADPQRNAETAANCVRSAPPSYPEDLARRFVEAQGLVQSQTFLSEVESFLSANSQQLEAEPRSLGDLPLIVLTRGQRSTNMSPEQAETEWLLWHRLHDQVTARSTQGDHRLVPDAGHYIQLDQPQVVIDTVLEVVQAARR
jgi:pimeloyl-ACP methyl ester carboxylesterase